MNRTQAVSRHSGDPQFGMLRGLAAVVILAPLLSGFGPGGFDESDVKDDLVAKLSSDLNKVDYSIGVTKELIQRSPDAPYLADLYFRLAELYVEKSRYTFARIMELQSAGDRVLSGEQSLEVTLNKRLAIETYDTVLGSFPEYENNDQVRFFKAHEFRELGRWDDMLSQYRELIDTYPKSPWAIEARLIIGDYHFDKGEFPQAEEQYAAIIAQPESHIHDMARYKLGWIRINQEQWKESLEFFRDAVASKRKSRKAAVGDASGLDVKREALLAMVWPYSEVRKANDAPKYFRRLADSKTVYTAALKKLANRYWIKTEYPAAASLYREIVTYSSDIGENIEYIQRIYESVRNMSERNPARYARAADDVDAIVTNVARFQNHISFSEEDKGRLVKDFEIRARDLATRLQQDAQRRKDTKSLRTAAEAYRKYLSLFTEGEDAEKMMNNRAESLFIAKDYLDAGSQFEEIAKDLDDSPTRRDVLYQSIQSYYESISEDTDYRRKHPTKPGLLNKLELVKAREGLKQLGAYYVKVWPKSDRSPNVKFNVARMFYQQGEYKRSAELFRAFVNEYPTHPDVAVAGGLALDALNKLDDYDGLAKLAQEFVDNPNVRDNRFKNESKALAEASRQRKVEFTMLEASSSGDFSETMLSEWEKNKDSKEGEEVLYNAFLKYKGEGNVEGVFKFGDKLMGAYPDSERNIDVLQTLGKFALDSASFERASFYLEEYQKRFPKEGNATELLSSAAQIKFMLGDYDGAAKTFRNVRGIGTREQKQAAHQKLMEIYAESSNWEQLARVAQTALEFNRNWLGASFHLGLAYFQQGKDELAQRELARAAQMTPRDEFDEAAQARSLFELGRLAQKDFDAIQFSPDSDMQQVLQAKLDLLSGIENAYGRAISTGRGQWVIAAAHGLARLYQGFAAFIAESPVPSGVDAQEYRQALKGEAAPYEAKAKELMSVCGSKSKELKIFSAYATACLNGSYDGVIKTARRARGSNQGGDSYRKRLLEVRKKLAKKPNSIEMLEEMSRLAMSAGDYHMALLALQKAEELDPRRGQVQNLLGVTRWQLGEPQEAYDHLVKAYKRRIGPAAANLAALFAEYGYENESRSYLGRAGDLSGANLGSPDYHPTVNRLRDGTVTAGGGT
ncbi:MAG: tetratricopeptide repeat protein [Myxococcota bacterium]